MSRRAVNKRQRLAVSRIHAFADTARLAQQLAQAVRVDYTPVARHRFPDGESLVRIQPPAGTQAVFVRSLHQPNAKLVETLLAADALRQAGAQQVTLIAPYLPYMRQDTVFTPGDPISQRVVGACLGHAFDRVMTVEAHLHRVHHLGEVIPCRAYSLCAAPVLAQWIQETGNDTLLVGPDEESAPWVTAIARAAQLPWMVGRKERLGDRKVRIHFPPIPRCARAVLVDDIASSGGTLAVAARALHRHGIATVDGLIVHAICAPGALARLRTAGMRTLVSCDTVPHASNAIGVAPLVATALQEERS